MKAKMILLLCASSVALLGCPEDKCQNPKRIVDQGGREGAAVKCNAVIQCIERSGPPRKPRALGTLEDPVIVDWGSSSWNRDKCIGRVRQMDLSVCGRWEIQVSPEVICLDGSGPLDGSTPDVGGPTGGTLVTVGVGSGDYYFHEESDDVSNGFNNEPNEEEPGE